MIWFLICLAVLIAAVVMWQDISPQLPRGLRLPSSSTTEVAPQASTAASAGEGAIDPSHWTIVSNGSDFRASREFMTPVRFDDTVYYPPILHLSCYHGAFYAWLDTSLPAAADAENPRAVRVRIDGASPELWARAQGTIIEAPHPEEISRDLLGEETLTATFAFKHGAGQTFRLRTTGLESIKSQISGCAPAAVVSAQ